MEQQAPLQSVHRKSYQTDCRPLADVMFAIIPGSALAFLGPPLMQDVPISVALMAMSVATAVLYKVFIDVLTVFRIPSSNVLLSALIVLTISKWSFHGDAANNLLMIILQMPMFTIATNHLLDGWRRKS